MLEQQLIDKAVQIMKENRYSYPEIKRIVWIKPVSPTENPLGSFAVEYDHNKTAAD
jgi:hypothetical protein